MSKAEFKFKTSFRVRWMEGDAQGIVFNGAYLGYLEMAQAEYFRNLGVAVYHLPRTGYFDFAVVKTTLEFKAPARIDDMLDAFVRVSHIGNTSLLLHLELYPKDGDRLLTSVEAVYVGYDAATETTRRVPDALRELIGHYEETGEVTPLSRFPELANAMDQVAGAGNPSV